MWLIDFIDNIVFLYIRLIWDMEVRFLLNIILRLWVFFVIEIVLFLKEKVGNNL